MADRGRDLKFSILSDLSKFDTDKPAQGLEDLADAATLAGDAVDKLSDLARGSTLDRVGDDARDGSRSLDDFADDAKTTARKVDTAFDAIAKSSKANLKGKLDDDTDAAKNSMRELGDEARDTGREMAASFTGSSDDIMGALQELGANAGVAFGPIGGALSIALGSGLGLFFADWQKKKEKLQEDVESFTAALVEGSGRLSEEFLNQQISGLDPKKLKELAQAATDAAVPVRDVIRAYAGDPEALERVNSTINVAAQRLRDSGIAGSEADPGLATYAKGVAKVSGELDITSEALDKSKTAYSLMREAMSDPVVPKVEADQAIADAKKARAGVLSALDQKIIIPVGVQNITRETQLALAAAADYARRHPVPIYYKDSRTGQRGVRDVP
jgi:hypothetical protein